MPWSLAQDYAHDHSKREAEVLATGSEPRVLQVEMAESLLLHKAQDQ